MMSLVSKVWKYLGTNLSLLFGTECACAAVWMFISLLLRSITVILRINSVVPYGIIFAAPLFIQLVERIFPLFKHHSPLLLIRLAESILGRLHPFRLLVIIPAHFFGCLMGTILFRLICPIQSISLLATSPILFDNSSWFAALIGEIFAVSLYVVINIALPEILFINKVSKYALSIAMLPLLFGGHVTFNPAAIYAIWYAYESGNVTGFSPLQSERLIGPFIGSAVGGIICAYFFPDDSSSWKRRAYQK